jgi:GNAT superfamily N-acetyltransferase
MTRPLTRQGVTVRPFRFDDADYQAISELATHGYPDDPTTPQELKHGDETRPKRLAFARLIAEDDGNAVGYGLYSHMHDAFHPQRFWIDLTMQPDAERHAPVLYDALLSALEPFKPQELYTWSREDMPRRTAFFAKRGFNEVMRSYESQLDLEAFDPAPYRGLEPKLAKAGIALYDLETLARFPDHRRKLFDLHVAIDRDVPMDAAYTPPPFDEFVRAHFDDPRIVAKTFIVAVHGEAFIGLSELFCKEAQPEMLTTGLTGVLRAYRGKKVALAMKVKAALAAKRLGYKRIRTWNAEHNRPMLAINERLGFKRRPATLELKKVF